MFKLLYSVCIFLFPIVKTAFSQRDSTYHKKHSFGLQLNPYINGYYVRMREFPIEMAFRYGYQLNDYLRAGPEVSLWVGDVEDVFKTEVYKVGGFVRFSVLKKSNITPFVEVSPYYYYRNSLFRFMSPSITQTEKKIDYYIAPGVSFFFIDKRLSLDLLLKWSHEVVREKNLGPFDVSYRLNFHFNRFR